MPIRRASVRPPPEGPRPKNKLIACLPADDFARLQPYLKTIPFKGKEAIHRRNEPIRHVVFPNGGVASVTTAMKDGTMVEIATVGYEGLVGIEAFFVDALMPCETMIQVPDTDAQVMPADAF